jgi:hypothetical protein
MTPLEIESQARSKYNAIGDTFWASSEIMHLIYEGCLELAVETNCIEDTDTDTSVANQQEYDFPAYAMDIKRVTYEGRKLEPISMREDDAITALSTDTAVRGTPRYYFTWNDKIYMRPVPAVSSEDIKVFFTKEPAAVTSASTLEVPTLSHAGLVNFCLREMCAKDENFDAAAYYDKLWDRTKENVKRYMKRRKRGDAFAMVQSEEALATSPFGSI